MKRRARTTKPILASLLVLCLHGTGYFGSRPAAVVDRPTELVVKIVTADETGAGIVVHVRDDVVFILTAYHIVKDANEIRVTFFAKQDIEFSRTSVFKYYEDLDIAVIRVTSDQVNQVPSDLPAVNIGVVPKVGDKLSTIGHPGDLEWQFDKEAYAYTRLGYQNDFRKFLYLNPALQRGSSGGPVLDRSSGVVGLVLKRGPSGNALAVTIDAALAVLNDWGVQTSKLIRAPRPVDPNFVVEVYEGSRIKRRKGVFVTLKNLITDAAQQRQTEESGLARFSIEDRSLCQVSLMTMRDQDWVTTILPADQNFALPYLKSVDISQIPSREWEIVGVSTDAWGQTSLDFAQAGFQNKVDLTSIFWPNKTFGDAKLKDEHLPWGVPKAERILFRTGYILGYDPKKLIPKWMAYRINLEPDYKPEQEDQSFWLNFLAFYYSYSYDPYIPREEQAEPEDYRRSGYAEGRFVGDDDIGGYGRDAVAQTYYISAIAPQSLPLRRSVWFETAKYARQLAANKSMNPRVWVIAGPAFISSDSKVSYALIGHSKVAVPEFFFRIVIKENFISQFQVLAFVFKNDTSIKESMQTYLTSIDTIEEMTGLDFFSDLAKEKQDQLESCKPSKIDSPFVVPRKGGATICAFQ